MWIFTLLHRCHQILPRNFWKVQKMRIPNLGKCHQSAWLKSLLKLNDNYTGIFHILSSTCMHIILKIACDIKMWWQLFDKSPKLPRESNFTPEYGTLTIVLFNRRKCWADLPSSLNFCNNSLWRRSCYLLDGNVERFRSKKEVRM